VLIHSDTPVTIPSIFKPSSSNNDTNEVFRQEASDFEQEDLSDSPEEEELSDSPELE
jgi:hypothetical protein